MHNEFTYVLEPPGEGETGYVAYCLEVPEANGQGETEAEALDSLRGAIRLVLECRREESLREMSATAHRGILTVTIAGCGDAPARESDL
jgi:predicted RNase H-like HicB family nuclease